MQLLSTSVTDEERASLKTMTDRQLKLMRHLLDDLLDLGRLKHGHIQLKKESIDLARFLRHVTDVTQSMAAERGQEVILRLPSEVVTFQADEARLEQIAMNLLSNASKYTPQGGCIEFSGARLGSEVVLRCKDNGRGIPREMQQKIFEPFTRVGPLTGSRGEASLGIGLALTKQLVELHEGTISVQSDVGRGSEFVVRLPLKPAPADKSFVPESTPSHPTQYSGSIVLVEDNADVAVAMGIALKQAGYRVTLFADAASALAGLSDGNPNAILLDIGLPDMDGYTLATKLRLKPNLRQALFVALSGFKQRETAETDDDFDHYFTKPVNYASLLRVLERPLSREPRPSITVSDPTATIEPPRTLLIDDHAPLAAAMAQLLRQEGLEVRTALSGAEGLSVALEFRPQLILCDLNLPDIKGTELIRKLRAHPDAMPAYSAILTALSASEVRSFNREAAQMGVDEFIEKPLTPAVIHSLLGRLKHPLASV
jgi:CheY-like chemotaxis protein/two-component sensor histidine kinase